MKCQMTSSWNLYTIDSRSMYVQFGSPEFTVLYWWAHTNILSYISRHSDDCVLVWCSTVLTSVITIYRQTDRWKDRVREIQRYRQRNKSNMLLTIHSMVMGYIQQVNLSFIRLMSIMLTLGHRFIQQNQCFIHGRQTALSNQAPNFQTMYQIGPVGIALYLSFSLNQLCARHHTNTMILWILCIYGCCVSASHRTSGVLCWGNEPISIIGSTRCIKYTLYCFFYLKVVQYMLNKVMTCYNHGRVNEESTRTTAILRCPAPTHPTTPIPCPMITHTIVIHIRSQVIPRQSQSYKF